jgi:FkbM family methyltransferase
MMLTEARVRLAAAVCRNTTDFPGRWRLLRRTLADVRAVGRGMRPTVVRTKQGFRMRCELEDWLSQHVFVSGSYEESTADLVSRLVPPGSTVVDVGANVGFYTMLFSRLVGATGRVIALEPMPLALTRLRRHLSMNRVRNVEVHAIAATADRRRASFFLGPSEHTSISSLQPRAGSVEITVDCAPLDDLVQGATVELIKIDAEGAEGEVLAGATRTLDRGVRHIVAEVNDTGWPARLLERGYRMFWIDWNGLRPLGNPNDPALPSQYNALFTLAPETLALAS